MAQGRGMPEDENQTRKKGCLKAVLMDNLLIILIIIAVGIGVGMGFGLRSVWSHEDLTKIWHLEWPGRLLLNMLKMLILPLIVSSLIVGVASIGNTASGKLGAGAILYYMSTTLIAVIIGIILVLSIHPGDPDDLTKLERRGKTSKAKPLDSLLDLITQCFPDNLVVATTSRRVTEIGTKEFVRENETDKNLTYTVTVDAPGLKTESGTNVLGLVVFSIALGCVINKLGEKGKPLLNFFESLNAATMILVHIVIWYTPIGIMFLVAGKFISTRDIGKVLSSLGLYMGTVLGGIAIHGLVVLPLLYLLFTRKNPLRFGQNMLRALFTAWGTASSSATLPITMDCLVDKNKIHLNIVQFVAPVGATINMDGTALYEAVASIFIAQVNDIDLSVADVIIISLTSTAAAIGAAGVPQAGLVTMVIVLTAVGLPTEDVTLILAVDWFLDRFRTVMNVWGDSIGCGILDHFFRGLFKDKDIDTCAISSEEDNTPSDSNSLPRYPMLDDKPPSYGETNLAFEQENTRM